MKAFINILFLLIFISVLFLGCKSGPVATTTAPDTREASVMADREQKEIEIEEKILKAAFNGKADELRSLIEDEKDIESIMKDCRTALLLASVRGHSESVKVLIDNGVDVDWQSWGGDTALMWAAGSKEDTARTVKVLIKAGADVNAKTEDGCTALMDAARQGNTEIVRLLLDGGAEVNAASIDGHTALTEASAGGYEEIVKLLESEGADSGKGY